MKDYGPYANVHGDEPCTCKVCGCPLAGDNGNGICYECERTKYFSSGSQQTQMVNCPHCNSTRIISARHDSDWGGGNSISAVNGNDAYNDGDLSPSGDVKNFGDIDILVCLNCDYTWQRYGKFSHAT